MNKELRKIVKKNKISNCIYSISKHVYYYTCSDEKRIRVKSKKRLGREVELHNPIRFTDKLQWLKLHWYDPLAVKCADKYEVRKIVRERIGEEFLNELIAVYDSIEEIDISGLPNKFVLKATHGSGYNFICTNKDSINWKQKLKEIKKWLNKNYHRKGSEWVYKEITPRIICERYLPAEDPIQGLIDYKFFCFNGTVSYCQVIRGRERDHETIDFYDRNWNHMSFTGLRNLPSSNMDYEKPLKYEEMIDLSEKLSKGFPFVRVDLYYVKENIYFGELTFFPMSGMGRFYPDEWDYRIGDLLQLPKERLE